MKQMPEMTRSVARIKFNMSQFIFPCHSLSVLTITEMIKMERYVMEDLFFLLIMFIQEVTQPDWKTRFSTGP